MAETGARRIRRPAARRRAAARIDYLIKYVMYCQY